MKTRRKAHALRSTGGLGRAPRSNLLQLARSFALLVRRFRVITRHITRVGATTQLDHTRTHTREGASVSRPPRAAARLRVARLRSRASVRADPDPPATLGRTLELAKTRAREDSGTPVARARATRGVRCGRLRGEGRVEAFRGSADASALPGTGDTARRRRFSGFPQDSSATVCDRPP